MTNSDKIRELAVKIRELSKSSTVKAEAIRKPRDVGLKQADLLKTGQAFYIQQRYSKSHKKMDALMDDFYTERVAPAKQNMIRLGGKK